MKPIYLVAIGTPCDDHYRIDGYAHTDKDAKAILRNKGYKKYNKQCNYYETEDRWCGKWARVFKVEELTPPEVSA